MPQEYDIVASPISSADPRLFGGLLPLDFEHRRDHYYAALAQPREPDEFIEPLRKRLANALDRLDRGLPRNRAVQIQHKAGGWIKLTPLAALPEPPNLERLQGEVGGR